MQFIRDVLKRVLPRPFIDWYRRRRALRNYLKALAYEIYGRRVQLELEDLEGRIAARRDGFYDRLVKDVLERTELILQQLDRKIEGVTARHGNELRALREELLALRGSLDSLRAAGDDVASRPKTPGPTGIVSRDIEDPPFGQTPREETPAPVDR